MTRKLIPTALAAVALGTAAVPAAASAAPVNVTGFSVSPSCVTPGGTVESTTTVTNITILPQTIYGQGSESVFGITLERGSVIGPNTVPPLLTVSQSESTPVPRTTPFGIYSINAGIGPSASSPTSWSQGSAYLLVSPFC